MGENPSPLGDDFSRLAVVMQNYPKTSHSVYDLKYHFVWITKYRKPVLFGTVGKRLRDLIREICKSMEIEIIKSEKDDVELKIDNQTLAEILRVYLNDNVDGVKFAAWKKENPSKPLIFRIQTSGKTVKKAVSDASLAIKKDCSKIVSGLKKK